jgi:hypothetical protein
MGNKCLETDNASASNAKSFLVEGRQTTGTVADPDNSAE